MAWLHDLLSAVLSVGLSLLATWGFGGWMLRRAEAARQDWMTRTTAAQSLRALRRQLIEEGTRRQARQQGRTTMVVRRPQFTIYEFQNLAWPVVTALDDPVMNRHVAQQAITRLVNLLGQHQIDYLRLLDAPPGRPTSIKEVSDRIRDAGLLEQEPNTPVDRMFQSDDPALVQAVVNEVDGIIALLRR